MADPIEDQIHRFLTDQEEDRCKSLEAEQLKLGKKGKVRRRTIKKPWTRPSDSALCQEMELLVLVDQYSYDLADGQFQAYCAKRGVLQVAGEPHSPRWRLMTNYQTTKQDFLRNKIFQRAEEVNGKQYEFTPREMENHWQIVLLGRAKLQDCWELYCMNDGHRD